MPIMKFCIAKQDDLKHLVHTGDVKTEEGLAVRSVLAKKLNSCIDCFNKGPSKENIISCLTGVNIEECKCKDGYDLR